MRPPAADRPRPAARPLAARVALTLCALAFLACAHAAPAPAAPARPPPSKVVLRAAPDANGGQPFYVVFQAVSEREFLTASYRAAADLAFTSSPGVLATVLVVPDREQTVELAPAEKDSVAAYFLFTSPGRSWKVLLAAPLTASHELAVAASEVELVR